VNTFEQQGFDYLYEQHFTNLTLQGKRPATIDAYSRAVRHISATLDTERRTFVLITSPPMIWSNTSLITLIKQKGITLVEHG